MGGYQESMMWWWTMNPCQCRDQLHRAKRACIKNGRQWARIPNVSPWKESASRNSDTSKGWHFVSTYSVVKSSLICVVRHASEWGTYFQLSQRQPLLSLGTQFRSSTQSHMMVWAQNQKKSPNPSSVSERIPISSVPISNRPVARKLNLSIKYIPQFLQ